ncbi:MAG: hypothetical protein MK132_06710 [Lentisphaerales bacterium]|nr:hypothetical protein [Lentisphaerales bacterium]
MIVLGSEDMASNRKCMLAPLSLVSLDLRGTQIYDLGQLKGMDTLQEIDIRNTLVTNLDALNNLPALKKVIVGKKQFVKRQTSLLQPRIQLLIK